MVKLKGFSILEIVIVMAIMVILASFVLPASVKDIRKEEVKTAARDIAQQITTQQNNSYVSRNNSTYGISFAQKTYTTFTGNSFSTGLEKEINTLPGSTVESINLTGGSTEITFLAGTFKPSVTGYIEVTNGFDSYRVTINKEGLVTTTHE